MFAFAATDLDGEDETPMRSILLPHFEYHFYDRNRKGKEPSLIQIQSRANREEYHRYNSDLQNARSLLAELQQQNTRPYWCGSDAAPQTLWVAQMTGVADKLQNLVLELEVAGPKIMAAVGIVAAKDLGLIGGEQWIVKS
ncbi:MAG: hypothetical protein Q9207_006912 [Kuettlingeria erythrocarpa]